MDKAGTSGTVSVSHWSPVPSSMPGNQRERRRERGGEREGEVALATGEIDKENVIVSYTVSPL